MWYSVQEVPYYWSKKRMHIYVKHNALYRYGLCKWNIAHSTEINDVEDEFILYYDQVKKRSLG